MKFRTLLFALLFVASPACAQWQTPNHSFPIGQGGGVTGFGSVGPCAVGVPVLGLGAAADPACSPLDISGAGAVGNLPTSRLSGNLLIPNFNGGTGASSSTYWGGDGLWHAFPAPVPSGVTVSNVVTYGATGNCATDDTIAVQSAVNAATAAGGSGIVYFPPVAVGGCYLVGAINATNKPNLTIMGNGDFSFIKVHGSSTTNHVWWDQSGVGCVNVTWRDLKITDDGSTIPAYLFLTGAVNTGLNTISCVRYDRVNISAKTTGGIFYGYGLANSGGYSGLSCRDSTWIQTNNGASRTPSLRNAVLVLDGINSRAVASDYVTLTGLGPGSDGNSFVNCNFTDWATGFGAGTPDNNAAVIQVTTGQVSFVGGSIQCTCLASWIFWTNNEGTTASDMVLQAPDGSVTITFFIDFGGGTNGEIGLNEMFWSVPKTGGCFVCMDAPVGSAGGINDLSVRNPDIGGNPNADKFILDIGGCASPPAIWIVNSYIQMQAGANDVFTCSSIDAHTSLINPGTVNLATGADSSRHQ